MQDLSYQYMISYLHVTTLVSSPDQLFYLLN